MKDLTDNEIYFLWTSWISSVIALILFLLIAIIYDNDGLDITKSPEATIFTICCYVIPFMCSYIIKKEEEC